MVIVNQALSYPTEDVVGRRLADRENKLISYVCLAYISVSTNAANFCGWFEYGLTVFLRGSCARSMAPV